MALPLGAVLCFLDLLGARALARGEVRSTRYLIYKALTRSFMQIALQTTFHGPLIVNPNYVPPPIFTRVRLPSSPQAELGQGGSTPIRERSFYKNTYTMVRPLSSCFPSEKHSDMHATQISSQTRRRTSLSSTSSSSSPASRSSSSSSSSCSSRSRSYLSSPRQPSCASRGGSGYGRRTWRSKGCT